MADGYSVKTPDGTVQMSSDEVGGVHTPRVKATFGADGSVSDVSKSAPMPVAVSADVSGGCDPYRNISLGATGQSVKGSAGTLYDGLVQNLHASSDRFVKLYDKASAPSVGTDTPKSTYRVKAGESLRLPCGPGKAFALGIGIAATTALADADTGAPGANEVVVNLAYK